MRIRCANILYEVNTMKHIRTRIAAAICAAAAAACALQAPAFAFANERDRFRTPETQDEREYARNFSHDLWALQTYYRNNGINTFSGSVRSGLVVGEGFSNYNLSQTWEGMPLNGEAAWARTLANSFYGNQVVYQELSPENRYTSISDMKPGDQIVMSYNGSKHTVFVTGLSADRIYCSELWGTSIQWSIEYSRTATTMTRLFGGTEYTIDYFIRPVKEGDANCDSVVDFMDLVWIANHVGQYNFPYYVNWNTQFYAADLNRNGQIDTDDVLAVYQHAVDGRMSGDYRYITTRQEG